MEPSTWSGSLISSPERGGPQGPAPYFRRDFEVGDGLRRATLHVSALGIVEPYLNGARIGDEVLAPGWTSYRHRVGVREYDVTASVLAGANAIGAIVGEGWASGRLGWEGHREYWTDRPALFLQLTLVFDDRVETIATDSSFRVGEGAVLSGSLYDGEVYDARKEPAGWSTADFDDSSWRDAAVFDWPLAALTVDAAPPIRRTDERAPSSIVKQADGRYLVDFGQNFAGWVRITVNGQRGETVTLRHAETLTPAGTLEPATNRTAEATDRYTLRGEGPETWEPAFTFHGFRYVEIDGWPGELSPEQVTGVVVHTEMRRTGWFECSDPLVSRLHENALWSMRSNFVGVPSDCPQRDERLGWTGDLNAFAPTATLLYDVREVLGSWLADVAAEQQEKGYVPWAVPDVLPTPSAPTAIWSDVVISLPWALYQEHGDPAILERSYDSMTTFMRQVEGQLDGDSLWSSGFQFGDWLDPDAPYDEPSAGKTDRHLVASAYLCRTTRELADSARILGRTDDAAHFDQLADRVRAAFRREYLSESGRIVNETVTAYALAICFDLLDADQRRKSGDRLAQLVAQARFRISTGFAGTPYVTQALASTGHLDEAYLLLLQKESPSFLYPVTMGATTIWERWDSILPDGTLNESGMTSLNHYALGAVTSWLYEAVAGIRRLAPGYSRVRIGPRPGGGISWANAAHETAHGRIEVAWSIDGEAVSLDLALPDGVEAEVVLPLHPEGMIDVVAGGMHTWTYTVPGLGSDLERTLDTPLAQVAENRTLWYSVTAALERHFPGMALDPTQPGIAEMSIAMLLGHIPNVPDGVEDELRTLLSGRR